MVVRSIGTIPIMLAVYAVYALLTHIYNRKLGYNACQILVYTCMHAMRPPPRVED
jgi:hypothetical protein